MSTIFTTTINYNNSNTPKEVGPNSQAVLACNDKLMSGNITVSQPALSATEITSDQIAITSNGDDRNTVSAFIQASTLNAMKYVPGGKTVSRSISIQDENISTTLKADNIAEGVTILGVTGTAYSEYPRFSITDTKSFITIESGHIGVGNNPQSDLESLELSTFEIGTAGRTWEDYITNYDSNNFSINADNEVIYKSYGNIYYEKSIVRSSDTLVDGGFYYCTTEILG